MGAINSSELLNETVFMAGCETTPDRARRTGLWVLHAPWVWMSWGRSSERSLLSVILPDGARLLLTIQAF